MCNKFSVITEENIKCTTTSSLIIQCLHSSQGEGGGGGYPLNVTCLVFRTVVNIVPVMRKLIYIL